MVTKGCSRGGLSTLASELASPAHSGLVAERSCSRTTGSSSMSSSATIPRSWGTGWSAFGLELTCQRHLLLMVCRGSIGGHLDRCMQKKQRS